MTGTEQRSLRDRVHDLATEAGCTFSVNQFDGGQFYQITQPGKGSVAASYEWGDDPDQIIAILRAKMIAAGMIGAVKHEYLLDFGSGRTARLWAPDERAAIRLAGQGEPESITDMTTGEAHDWVSP